jgi:hypothetical protein
MITRDRPKIVAVELPGSLEDAYLRSAGASAGDVGNSSIRSDPGDDERGIYVPVEPCDPFTEAVRSALEIGAEVVFLEPDPGERPHLPDSYPDTYAMTYIGFDPAISKRIACIRRIAHGRGGTPTPRRWPGSCRAPIRWRSVLVVVSLNLLDPAAGCDGEVPQDQPPPDLGASRSAAVESASRLPGRDHVEYPYLQERYEMFRQCGRTRFPREGSSAHSDAAGLKDAEARVRQEPAKRSTHWQRRMMARFTRNLALISGDLMAGVFDLTVAARSVVDDNYAWEVWQMANRYPAQKDASDMLETVTIFRVKKIWMNTKKLRLRRRLAAAEAATWFPAV